MKALRKATFCLLMVASSGLFGQEFRATISGEVTDQSGAAVTGAKVIALSVERNVPYEAVTNNVGRYIIQFLLPGKYTVTVEQAGFKKYLHEGIQLFASDKAAVDIKLELGAVADSVTVSGEVSLLQTESATRQATVENRILENVPSGGRNLYALQYDEPGVVKTSTYWGSMELYAFGNVNGVSISGGRGGENETVLDGVSNTKSDRGVAFVPSLQSTQEFTIQTNSYDAQFGRVGGGVTMITVKSGTNAIHGQLYEFLKNEKLRANDWVANKDGDPNAPFKNNTFGFEVDGPVYIPKVFDGRNKTFFMISMEGLREHSEGGELRTMPTSDMLKGDFSKLLNDDGNQVTIYDPLSTRLGPDGTTYVRTPFSGNVLPATRVNPIASKVASYYPAPNLVGDGPAHLNNYAKLLPETNTYDSWLGKMDLMASDRSHVSFRYGQTPWLNFAKLVWGNNPAEPSNEYPSTRVARNWGADWTYTISPSLVFNLRGGLARYEGYSGNSFGAGFDPAQLGFPSSLTSQFSAFMFPRFNLGNYSEAGPEGGYSYNTQDAWSVQPNISWTHGRHFLKVGTEFRRYNDNNISPGYASGVYNFDTNWTQANPLNGDSASGNEFATFLLGYPTSGYVDRNISPAFRSKYYAAFLQDDFKMSKRLTLNVGFRWDYESPRFERYNRMLRGWAFGQASPIASAAKASADAASCPACAAGLTGGLVYAGTSGDQRYAFNPSKANFQPRVGVAFRVSSRMVARGGYGLSYLGQSASGQLVGFSRRTPLVASIDGGLTPAATLSDPYPASTYPNGLLQPIGNTQGLSTNLGQSVTAQYLDRPLPYSHQYSAGLQYELHGWLLDASYVGNQTRRLPVSVGLNFLPLDVQNSIPVDQRASYFNASVANPMAGLLPNSGLNGANVPRRQLLYAYPQYNQVTITDVPIGSQRYDSIQLKATHRFSMGFTTTVAYTIAKNLERVSVLNPQDVSLGNLTSTGLEKRLNQYDVPQQLSIIGTYDLPVGRGRHFLPSMNRWANGVIGGWTVSGVWMSHSGFPLNFPNAAPLVAKSAKLSDSQRDALAAQQGRTQYDPSYDVWFDTSIFPRTAGPAPYTLRTFPTRFPDVRSKPLNVADFSLYKEFVIKERVRWQIRCDAHNTGNFPWFGNLDGNGANVTNSMFGHLRADIGNETRVVVGVLKIVF